MNLTVAEILEQLELNRGSFPREAVEAAVERRKEITPELLRILDEAADRPEELVAREAYLAHIFAFYLLAQFREPAAYPRIIRFFRLPGKLALDATGELATEGLDRILASVAHGDAAPIRRLIEDVEPCHVWDRVADLATDLHPGELADDLRRAYQDGLIDPFFISPRNVESALRRSRSAVIEQSRGRSRGLITDTVAEMHWWACFEPEPRRDQRAAAELGPWKSIETVRKAGPKVGRNDPCPCGSGKKYKVCCRRRST